LLPLHRAHRRRAWVGKELGEIDPARRDGLRISRLQKSARPLLIGLALQRLGVHVAGIDGG
jgi:hypothetical protein